MSKIGKINISIPEKVKVVMSGSILNIEGPMGKKSLNIQADLNEFDKCFFAGPKLESQFLSKIQKKKINYEFFKVKN